MTQKEPLNKICIFCKQDSSESKSREHILPESMGCPKEFYLKPHTVCDQCNNNTLARLDSDLQECFGLIRPYFISENKKGKPLTVKNKYYYAENNNGHVSIHINVKGKPVEIKKGIRLKSIEDNKKPVHSFYLERDGNFAHVRFKQNFTINDNVKRALYKIAFEYFCFSCGKSAVLEAKFDPIRDYVISGIGKRSILMGEEYKFLESNGIHQFGSQSIAVDKTGTTIIGFLLFNVTFIVLLLGAPEKLIEIKNKAEEMFSSKFVLL